MVLYDKCSYIPLLLLDLVSRFHNNRIKYIINFDKKSSRRNISVLAMGHYLQYQLLLNVENRYSRSQ